MTLTVANPVESLLDATLSTTKNAYVILKQDELQSTDDMEASKQALQVGGQWDNIPSIGYLSDVWFSKEALSKLSAKPSYADRYSADITLEHRESYKTWSVWVQLPSGADRVAVFDCAGRCHPILIERIHQVTQHEVAFSTLTLVHQALALRYLPNAGFTTLTYKQISAATRFSARQIRTAIDVLVETGLWGISRGTGNHASRFYPLFTDDGLNAYETFLGL